MGVPRAKGTSVCLSVLCAHRTACHVSYGGVAVGACPLPGSTSMSPSDSSGQGPRGPGLCRVGPPALSPGIRVVSRQPGGSDAGEAACGSWESRGQSAVGLLHHAPSPAAPAAHKSTGKPAAASGTARAAGCRATARQSPGPGSAACPLGGFGKSPHHSQPHSLMVKGRNRK